MRNLSRRLCERKRREFIGEVCTLNLASLFPYDVTNVFLSTGLLLLLYSLKTHSCRIAVTVTSLGGRYVVPATHLTGVVGQANSDIGYFQPSIV